MVYNPTAAKSAHKTLENHMHTRSDVNLTLIFSKNTIGCDLQTKHKKMLA